MDINHYELDPTISIEKLEKIGFKHGGWMSNIPSPKMSYVRPLVKDIELCIEINTDTFDFDDGENIFIWDDNFGQAYYPFYDSSEFGVASRVKRAYNDKMDSLVDEGLFKKANVKVKKKTM